MNKQVVSIALFFSLLTVSCSTDDFEISVEQPTHEWSEAEEINHWIYEEMNHYYFWRDDLPDSLNCDFTITPKEFYESLLSPKDRFSYFTFNSRGSEDIPNLGFEYQKYRDKDGNIVYEVLYINSRNAERAGIKRGDIVAIDNIAAGIISLTLIDTNGNKEDETIRYEIPTINDSNLNETVMMDSIYCLDDKKIGYICYLEYDNPADLQGSFKKFAENHIDELILDLRYNPGGLVSTCKKLCNMIVTEEAYGKMFQQCSYNDIVAQENLIRYGTERTFTYFSQPNNSMKQPILGTKYYYLSLPRVYILTSKHTASASEATINSLKPYMDVVVIGENTVGKGVGMQTISTYKYKYALVPITFRFYNCEGESIPDNGITPDFYVSDGYDTPKREIGELSEPLLAKAIELITSHNVEPEMQSRCAPIKDFYLIPIGEPSYVVKFCNKQAAL